MYKEATGSDSAQLSAIIVKAKGYWQYPPQWMDAWCELLTISADYIDNNAVVMLVDKDVVIGFYAIEYSADQGPARLDNLWIDPVFIGKGYGRQLFEHACNIAFKNGCQTLQWDADPNAEGFYSQLGALKIGEVQADVLGVPRVLPTMEISLI
ncbi:MAG: GNAT family N-acetyltransferase [Oceanospirillaceae bacterium]|nr:GNAT family N-acetyltransferase [Oceanospirillaceae bacterium]